MQAAKQGPGDDGDFSVLRGREMGKTAAEEDVRSLYQHAPYPDLGAALKDPSKILARLTNCLNRQDGLRYLEAGCGTGHFLVGTAVARKDWSCAGIDLSGPSLNVARQLAERYGVSVELEERSYLDALPWDEESFDIISAQGTIHHCDDPIGALINLKKYLKPDGLFSVHVYGQRLDAGKFDLKEMISIFQPNLSDYEERFAVYKAILEHEKERNRIKRWLDTSPLDVIRAVRTLFRNMRRRGSNISWSPPWTDEYHEPNSPWRDHFCHPMERAYEVPDIKELVTGAGLKVVDMTTQGREDMDFVPPSLRERFAALDEWDRWRFMELVGPARSFSMILSKT